jgi:hypothetical protein
MTDEYCWRYAFVMPARCCFVGWSFLLEEMKMGGGLWEM